MGHFNGFSRYFAEGSLLARLFFRFLVDPAELNTEGSARRRFFVSVAFAEGAVGAVGGCAPGGGSWSKPAWRNTLAS